MRGLQLLDGGERRRAVAGLADDRESRLPLEQLAQSLAEDRVVVCDEDGHRSSS